MIRGKWLSILGAAAMVSGCANWDSVYRTSTLARSGKDKAVSVVVTDAKSRAILVSLNDGKLRACAENAPDIFTVLSAGLAMSGNYGQKADGLTAEGKLAASISASGASIQRSQTFNLLALSMYRTCERFLNGNIDGAELALQARRDSNAMLAILAIEQLTTLGRPPAPVILTGGGTSASLPAVDGATLEEARKRKEKADKDAAASRKAYDDMVAAANDDPKSCAGVAAADQNGCTAKKTASDKDAEAATDAAANLAALRKAVSQSTAGSSTAAATSITIQNDPADAQTTKVIADTVWRITERALTMSACFGSPDEKSCLVSALPGKDSDAARKALANVERTEKGGKASATSLSGKLYVQIAREDQRLIAVEAGELTKGKFPALAVYGVELVAASPDQSAVRYFNPADKEKAEYLAAFLTELLHDPVAAVKVDTSGQADQMELWLGKAANPHIR
ncbi:MAG: hypothetical protein ABW039_03860 [Sphingobium sp.]